MCDRGQGDRTGRTHIKFTHTKCAPYHHCSKERTIIVAAISCKVDIETQVGAQACKAPSRGRPGAAREGLEGVRQAWNLLYKKPSCQIRC